MVAVKRKIKSEVVLSSKRSKIGKVPIINRKLKKKQEFLTKNSDEFRLRDIFVSILRPKEKQLQNGFFFKSMCLRKK